VIVAISWRLALRHSESQRDKGDIKGIQTGQAISPSFLWLFGMARSLRIE